MQGRLTLIEERDGRASGLRDGRGRPAAGALPSRRRRPLAAGLLDEVIPARLPEVHRLRRRGVLDREIAVGHVVVPTSAVRDEGISYHYLPPAREVKASAAGTAAIERVCWRTTCPTCWQNLDHRRVLP